MKELLLKHTRNGDDTGSRIFMEDDGELPLKVLNGELSYANILTALKAWQLVRELRIVLRLPAAASFNATPVAAAVGIPLSTPLKRACFVDDIEKLDSSGLACAYARARGADRLNSHGDWVALSDTCDITTARILEREYSNGIIAPGYDTAALKILKAKRKGTYKIIQIDPDYEPEEIERRQVFGVTLQHPRNNSAITSELLNNIVTKNNDLPVSAARDLLLTLVTLKYTQPNTACCAISGQTIGIGTGQQSMIRSMRVTGTKASNWFLRTSPKVLSLPFWPDIDHSLRDKVIDSYINQDELDVCTEGLWPRFFSKRPEPFPRDEQLLVLRDNDNVALGTDIFFEFSDSIEGAHRNGIRYIAQPGGSVRDQEVINCCNSHQMVMALVNTQLFHQ